MKKRILIIGGTGTIGQRMLERWSTLHQLTIVSRDNHKKSWLSSMYPSAKFVLCDIENIHSVRELFLDKDIIIHAAAIKNVDVGQADVGELIRVNISGTQRVAEMFERYATGVGIFLSSDKAVQPTNTYGYSKAVGEAICRQAGMKVLRYGNVVGSQGSFIPIWKRAIAEGKPIVARDATRFFLTVDQAISLISDAVGTEGELFIPRNLKGFSIVPLARYIAGDNVEIKSLTPGEKQHEQLLSVSEVAIRANEPLSQVEWGVNTEVGKYFSNTVEQMSCKEVLRKVLW